MTEFKNSRRKNFIKNFLQIEQQVKIIKADLADRIDTKGDVMETVSTRVYVQLANRATTAFVASSKRNNRIFT